MAANVDGLKISQCKKEQKYRPMFRSPIVNSKEFKTTLRYKERTPHSLGQHIKGS